MAMPCFATQVLYVSHKGLDKAVLLAQDVVSLHSSCLVLHKQTQTDRTRGVREAVVLRSQGRGMRWTPLRSWMKLRRGRMLAMAFSSRPSMLAVTVA